MMKTSVLLLLAAIVLSEVAVGAGPGFTPEVFQQKMQPLNDAAANLSTLLLNSNGQVASITQLNDNDERIQKLKDLVIAVNNEFATFLNQISMTKADWISEGEASDDQLNTLTTFQTTQEGAQDSFNQGMGTLIQEWEKSGNSDSEEDKKKLSPGAVAGIVIGCLAVVAIAVTLIVRKRKPQHSFSGKSDIPV